MNNSSTPLKRPAVSEVTRILAERDGLIVHFSGAPKGAGVERNHLYPDDLLHVHAGYAMGGVSCSIVMPGDNFYGIDRNATGCVGLVLELIGPESLVAVSPFDCGSIEQSNGIRTVANPCDITIDDIEGSISLRSADCYNEWVVRDFNVVGVFAVAPFEISVLEVSKYPDEMPYWLHNSEPDFNVRSTNLAEIRKVFHDLPIYTFKDGRVEKIFDRI